MNKDKTYIFRYLRKIEFLPDLLSEKEAKDKLIQAELERGYIPINVQFEKIDFRDDAKLKVNRFDRVFCYSAYAGKKSAKELFKTLSTDQIRGRGGDIIHFPYKA